MTEKTLRNLAFYTKIRKTGKTTLLRKGVENYDKPFFLVCKTQEIGKMTTNNNPHAIYITPYSYERLVGSNYPIIFDQEFVEEMLTEILDLKVKLTMFKLPI